MMLEVSDPNSTCARQGEGEPVELVPWPWLVRAGRCPGRAQQVALMVWYRCSRHQRITVEINLSDVARRFCFDRASATRGLKALVAAGLVGVERLASGRLSITMITGGGK